MTPHSGTIVGFCRCGCGRPTRIAPYDYAGRGWKRGIPIQFVSGHNQTKNRRNTSQLLPFKIDGVYCRLIALTNDQFTIVDAADYEELSRFNWQANLDKSTGGYYAQRGINLGDGKFCKIIMHRLILGLAHGDKRIGDHIYPGNTLDNRRKNLRIVNDILSSQNKRLRDDNVSGCAGVSPVRGKWISGITVNKIRIHLGTFSRLEDAIAIRKKAELRFFGEDAEIIVIEKSLTPREQLGL